MSDQKEMQKAYDAKSVEDDIYAAWEKSGYFTPENLPDLEKRTESFSIVLPPPNVTGTLHIGHAVMLAIEDIMIRYARMRGKKALWLPGTDHAAIATQTKVEKLLIKEGMEDPRRELGREEFLKRVDKFAQDSHDTIVNQMKKMGTSVDWTREAFTLDDARNLAVRTQFKKMYDDGLIYRGNRVINWCPRCKSTLADDEVEHKEGTARLYTFTYDKDFPISISTTRPETKFGDTAVAVNPKDKRYKKFVGQELTANYCGNELKIKIIADDVVDMDFGTGALGVTPAHSNIDAEMARKHDLVSIQVIDEEGRMINSPEVEGMFAVAAREKAVVWLKENGLLQNDEDAPQNLSVCYRCDTPIEPLPKIQWFINVNKKFKFNQSKENPIDGIKDGQEVTLKELMQHVVRSKQIKVIPDHFDKTYFHWIDNLRDWNISRQLWYGHRVPVWYRTWQPDGDEYVMGFHERTVESIKDGGKTVTYRLRDHGVKEGDHFAFENSQAKVAFGYGTILKIEKKTVGLIPLADPAHGATYEKREQLIEAFQFHHPEMKVTEETPVWVYTYSFGPSTNNRVQETAVGVDAPKGKNWEQDPDTLDTWFSAGLWTFSTLGWPEQTDDLKTFHPTDVMETGYDILFFWVARMILMTTYALGEIPFKHVYLHGLVRDEKGRKMSKSLDNAIDPLDMINEYGADATRISLIIGSTPGNDTKMSEDKVANYRNFTNKLWNIARYIMTSVNDVQSIEDVEAVTLADRWILGRLGKVTEKVTKHFENYEYSLAGETLRDFTWNEFADWYLEISKIQKDANTDKILLHILERVLIMWHPFMPFVTEEIYKRFDQGMLIVASWPEVKTKLAKKDEKLFAEMQGVISALRNVRARYKIPNKEKLSAIIVAGTHLQDQSEIIKKLARVENLSFDDKATKPSGSSSAVIGNIQVYVPLEGIVNLEAEKQKLGKELAQVGAYTASLTKKLANESFIRNAPEEVVEQQRQALKEVEEKEQVLKQEIDNLE